MRLQSSFRCCLHSNALCFSISRFSSATFFLSFLFHGCFLHRSLIDLFASIRCANLLSTCVMLFSSVSITLVARLTQSLSSVAHSLMSSMTACWLAHLRNSRKAPHSDHLNPCCLRLPLLPQTPASSISRTW